MRFRTVVLCFLTTILASACDNWPRQLESLAESIAQEVSGEVTAWRVSGDVVGINVTHSPLYRESLLELETAATDIAAQTITVSAVPLKSISVTFHEGDVSEEAERMHAFIFLVRESQAVLQPLFNERATGPLMLAEIKPLFIDLNESRSVKREECVLREIEKRARAAGDPETLDPTTVEFLPVEKWQQLDRIGKRLILGQVISTKARFVCRRSDEQPLN